MAKRRMIDTRFWSDNFIVELNPLDRYLFLYFLTNEHTNICGIYELPLKRMSDETGIEKDMILKMLKRLKGRVAYIESWVAIKNFSKYQSDNESVRQGIKNAKSLIPSRILQRIDKVWEGVDTLGGESDILEPELKLESEPELKAETSSAEVSQIIKLFEELNPNATEWYRNKTQRKAISFLLERVGYEKLSKLVEKLPEIISQKFAPKITTPFELKRDWSKLKAFFDQDKQIKNKREILI